MKLTTETSVADLSPKKRLEKLDLVRRIFIWPVLFWFFIVLADFVIYVMGIQGVEPVRDFIANIAFYSLPLFLLYLAAAAFFGSYILGGRVLKNLATFAFFQLLAVFLVREVGIGIRDYDKLSAALLTGVVGALVWGALVLVQKLIVIPNLLSEGSAKPANSATGMIMAAMVSLVIASMVYFRAKGGIAFVSWGVIFGILLSTMSISADKMVLCVLYFLDPRGAFNLFQLIKLKERVRDQKDQREIEAEEGELQKEEMKAQALRLANQLNHELVKVYFKKGERQIKALIDGLRETEGLPADEQERRIAQARELIEQMRIQEDIPKGLPQVDYSKLSLGEKMSAFAGLSNEETEQAIAEGLIDPSQRHLWLPQSQAKIRTALLDFEENRFKGGAPVFVADSLVEFFNKNRFILAKLVDVLQDDSGSDRRPIVGGEGEGLLEVAFSTVTRRYTCVLKAAPDGSFLVLGVFDRPEPEGEPIS